MYQFSENDQNIDIISDILQRREFIQLTGDQEKQQTDEIQFKKYQLFSFYIGQYLSNCPRFLIKHGTGTGKTLTSLLIAKSFIDNGQKVLILGYQKKRFIDDALTIHQLGFVSQEISNRYQQLVLQNAKALIPANEFKKQRRIMIQQFLKFHVMGYRKFHNEMQTSQSKNEINLEFMMSLWNGLIICDEVHNVYNSLEVNNWGESLQLISAILQRNIKMIFMSGTPINNPQEIYDLCNLMYSHNLKSFSDKNARLQQIETITDNNNKYDDNIKKILKDIVLFPDRISTISNDILIKVFSNSVSFFPQISAEGDTPELLTTGEIIQNNLRAVISIPGEFEKTILNMIKDRNDIRDESLFDWAYIQQDEEGKNKIYYLPKELSSKTIKDQDIIIEQSKDGRNFISGICLAYQNVLKYSSKFHTLLKLISQNEGKSMIYHNHVTSTGILTIRELLIYNGHTEYGTKPQSDSVCFKCKVKISDHASIKDHIGKPSFFAMRYGEINLQQGDKILDTFNSIDNIEGAIIKYIIGSRTIREGIDFKELKHIYVLSLPYNISNLIQIIGRGVRNGSHARLPVAQRQVKLHILISPLYEKQQYVKAMNEFSIIIDYESVIDGVALDSSIYFVSDEERENSSDSKKIKHMQVPVLGIVTIPFDVRIQKIDKKNIKDYTYNAYHLFEFEMMAISNIIDMAFKKYFIWKYNDLLEFISTIKYIPNPIYFQEKYVLYMLKRKQYFIIEDYVMRKQVQQIEQFFRRRRPPMQKYKIESTHVFSQSLIDTYMEEYNNILQQSQIEKWDSDIFFYRYIYMMMSFYRKHSKDVHIQLIKYMIEKGLTLQLHLMFGNTILFNSGKRTDKIVHEFPGKGFNKSFNAHNTDHINGFEYDQQLIIYRKGVWDKSTLKDSKIQIEKTNDNIVLGMYSDRMYFKILDREKEPDTQDLRFKSKGVICHAQSKAQLQDLYKKYKKIFSASFTKEQYDKMLQVYVDQHGRKPTCELLETMMFMLDQKRVDGKRWYYLLERKYGTEREKKKMLDQIIQTVESKKDAEEDDNDD